MTPQFYANDAKQARLGAPHYDSGALGKPTIMIVVASSFEALCKNKLMPDAIDLFMELSDVCILVSTCQVHLPKRPANAPPHNPLKRRCPIAGERE